MMLSRVLAWLNENKKARTASLLCASLLIVNLLLYAVLIVPSARTLKAGEAMYAELRKRRAEAVQFRKQKQELAGVKAGIPAQKDMPLLVKELVQSARRLKLSVDSIQYDMPRRSGEELAMLTFSFPSSGRYANVKRFIHHVETSDRFIGIHDLKLKKDRGRVKMEMKLLAYVKGQ